MREYLKFYIDGQWADPVEKRLLDAENPVTEQVCGWIALGASADVDNAVAAARRAFDGSSQSSRADRLELPAALPAEYQRRSADLADAVGEEMGAPRTLAEAVAVAAAAAEKIPVGDQSDPRAIGAVASRAQFDKIQRLIQAGIDEGADLVAGGPGRPEIGNDTDYGLYGYASGADADRAGALARRIRAGTVAINHALDISAPFGGYKQSGNGREWGEFGFHDFLEVNGIVGYGRRAAE